MKHLQKLIHKLPSIFFTVSCFVSSFTLYAQEEEEPGEFLPFDAVIQSEMGGKRMKFYGNTRFNFNLDRHLVQYHERHQVYS